MLAGTAFFTQNNLQKTSWIFVHLTSIQPLYIALQAVGIYTWPRFTKIEMFHTLDQIDRWDTGFIPLGLLQIKSPTHCPFNKRRWWTFKFITIYSHHNPSDCCKTLHTVSLYLMTFIHQYHYYIMHMLHSNYQYENTFSLYICFET